MYALVLAGLAIPLVAARPPGVEPGRPAIGRLLISTRQVEGPFFARSLVLLLEHGPGGAVGLILNRPSPLMLGKLAPELADAELGRGRVHLGGPVSPSSLLLLFRTREQEPPSSARRVLANLYVGGGGDTLAYLHSLDMPTDQVRTYLGYAGWAAGQLEYEIARGDWVVIPGKADFVFHPKPETLWPELIAKHGGVWATMGPRSRSLAPQVAESSVVARALCGEAS